MLLWRMYIRMMIPKNIDSVGITQFASINKSLSDLIICIYSAISQERPAAADLFDPGRVDLAYDDLFGLSVGLGDDDAEGVGEEGVSPEFDARRVGNEHLVSDAVDSGNVNAVCDSMRTLNGSPAVLLLCSVSVFFIWVPSYCGRIKEYLGPAQ